MSKTKFITFVYMNPKEEVLDSYLKRVMGADVIEDKKQKVAFFPAEMVQEKKFPRGGFSRFVEATVTFKKDFRIRRRKVKNEH